MNIGHRPQGLARATLGSAAIYLSALSCLGASSQLELAAEQSTAAKPPPVTQEATDPNAGLGGSMQVPTATTPPLVVVGRVTWPIPADRGHFVSAWAGTTVGVRFTGTGLVAKMADTHAAPLADPTGGWGDRANAWDVSVDGLADANPLIAKRAPSDIVVAEGLALGEHEVWLTRQTEAVQLGRVEFFGVRAVDGDLLPPPVPRARRIEVVGTSVETGLHVGTAAHDPNEVWVANCPIYPRALNQNRAWPKLAAEALNAELINTSMQGAGLILGYTDFAGAGVQLPGIYSRTDIFVPAPQWDPIDHPVDVILAVAGWSDVNQLNPTLPANASRLQAAYEAFLGQLRAAQPGALIYAVVRTSDSPQFYRSSMSAIIQAAVTSRQDDQMRLMALPAWQAASANCDDHPTWALQSALAAAAAARIRSDMRW